MKKFRVLMVFLVLAFFVSALAPVVAQSTTRSVITSVRDADSTPIDGAEVSIARTGFSTPPIEFVTRSTGLTDPYPLTVGATYDYVVTQSGFVTLEGTFTVSTGSNTLVNQLTLERSTAPPSTDYPLCAANNFVTSLTAGRKRVVLTDIGVENAAYCTTGTAACAEVDLPCIRIENRCALSGDWAPSSSGCSAQVANYLSSCQYSAVCGYNYRNVIINVGILSDSGNVTGQVLGGASVRIASDGVTPITKTSGSDGKTTPVSMRVGYEYTFRVSKDGYTTVERSLTIPDGTSSYTYNVRLQESSAEQPPSGTGGTGDLATISNKIKSIRSKARTIRDSAVRLEDYYASEDNTSRALAFGEVKDFAVELVELANEIIQKTDSASSLDSVRAEISSDLTELRGLIESIRSALP